MPHNQSNLWWAYENEQVKQLAKSPMPLSLTAARLSPDSPFRYKTKNDPQKIIKETNYKVMPSDCGPFRLISSYGFVAYAPTDITIEALSNAELNIESVHWPFSENGCVATPIEGSDYIKIYTGIMIFFSSSYYLYQGPIPNDSNILPRVMSGLEYPKSNRRFTISNVVCGLSNLNAVIHKPILGQKLIIKAGQPLLWFFLVPKRDEFTLEYIGDEE